MTKKDQERIRKTLGLVHVYTGDGKGKTTAALGLAMRALEHGLTVNMVQFLKGGTYIGELLAPQRYKSFSIQQVGKGSNHFPRYEDFSPDTEDRARALLGLKCAFEHMKEGKTDVLLLDEINVALQLGHLELGEVLSLIENKPTNVELVMTGRGAPEELRSQADYVTEMLPHKHPFDNGILGRKGIDY